MTLLQDYAKFLRENHLEEFAKEELQIVKELDIPIMKLLEHLTEEQLVAQTLKGAEELLSDFESGNAIERVKTSLRDWEANRLEQGIQKDQIQPSDLVLIYAAQEMTLTRFIDRYTPDSKKAVSIMNEMLAHFVQAEDMALDVLFKIRKEAEEALKQSEERFRSVSQTALDGIIIADADQLIIYWNPGAERIFGYSHSEIIGKSIEILVPTEKIQDFEDSLKALTSKAGDGIEYSGVIEVSGLRKDGTEVPLEVSRSYWKANNDRFFSFMVHDITARIEAERKLAEYADELKKSNQELEQFAYIASHDLKEPLRMVSNYTQLLQRRYGEKLDKDGNQYMTYAVEGAKRMGILINDLLNYSRVNTAEIKFEKVDLNEVMKDVILNLTESLKESEADLHYRDLPTVLGDSSQLLQVFQNLISNAIKFVRHKPEISIASVRQNGMWCISVKDNGIGINPEYNDKVFVMFQRLNNREEFPGTGIGLAICKRIIERHGGRIWFQSKLGEGSTFFFTLKAA